MTTIDLLNKQPFISELKKYTQGIYLVGGIVRDYFLDKESKDIDLLVTGLEIENIISILKPFGTIGEVGKSFAVIKFVPTGMELSEPIDIAIPRKDIKVGEGHTAFEIVSDPYMPIEVDLERRDITINSMAMSIVDKSIVDPFGGMADLEAKLIRATSHTAFMEDALRMLRVTQFASRFGFDIEENTLQMIKEGVELIDTISGERIMEELDKIYYKGDRLKGVGLLIKTGLFKQIFGTIFKASFMNISCFNNEITRTEFYYLLLQDLDFPATFYSKRLKGDVDTFKGLQAIELFHSRYVNSISKFDKRFLILDMLKKSMETLHYDMVKVLLSDESQEFISGKMPHSIKDLVVTGDMLIEMKGFKQGKVVGDKLQELLKDVITEKRSNTLEDLLRD
jgi:tRNA nucleotidyltransferase (CCA-adding enzyme)